MDLDVDATEKAGFGLYCYYAVVVMATMVAV